MLLFIILVMEWKYFNFNNRKNNMKEESMFNEEYTREDFGWDTALFVFMIIGILAY